MKGYVRLLRVLGMGGFILAGAASAPADITFGVGLITSRTYDGTVATNEGYVQINPVGTVTATRPGGNFSTTGYSVSSDALDFDFSQGRVGSYQSYSESGAIIPFQSDVDVAYQLSGLFGLRTQDAGRLYLALDLYDSTTNQIVFRQVSESRQTPGESFALGTVDGDHSHVLFGSTTGTLVAGHQYVLSFQLRTHAFLAPDTGALATGDLSLDFLQVPAPGASVLGVIGLAVLTIARRQTRTGTDSASMPRELSSARGST